MKFALKCIVVLCLCGACMPTAVPASQVPPSKALTPQSVAQRPTATPDERTITLAAVGDVMLGRYVGRMIATRGATYPFSATRELLAGDILLGNLESPLTTRRAPALLRPGPYRLPADPAAVDGLRSAGFTALSLANNHALDAGPDGLAEAADVLQSAHIAPLGVGKERAAALQPVIIERNGLRIALLAANDVADPADQPDEEGHWGRAALDEAFLDAVRSAHKHADLVITLVHWGTEYAAAPGLRQREQATALVAAGADVVLGAHPHVLQPITVIEQAGRRALVAYSLGNFVFDQPFSPETSRSAVLRITLGRAGVLRYDAAPVAIVDGQPRPLAASDAAHAAVLRDLGLAPTDQATAPRTTPAAGTLVAYSWNGTTFEAIPPPMTFAAPTRLVSATADLRGDGSRLLLTLDNNGSANLHNESTPASPIVWHNESPTWRITQILPGDSDNDGRYEFLLILWKPDDTGILRCHPFLLGWRNGRYRIFWGGSAVNEPIQMAALGDVDGDGQNELVVVEGGDAPAAQASSLSVWRWHGWGFERLWRTPIATAHSLAVQDFTGDGRLDIVLLPAP